MKQTVLAISVLLPVALSHPALGADITSGNASMNILETVQLGSFIPFTTPNGDGALRLDGAASQDLLYKYCWYYKTPIGSNVRLFSDLLNPTRTLGTDTVTYTWINNGDGAAGGQGRFDATLTIRLTDGPAAGQGRVESQMRIRNAGASPTTIRIYHLLDLDLPGGVPNPGPDDTLSLIAAAPLETRYTESSTANYATIVAPAADRHRIDAGLTLRSQLLSTLTDLTAETGPYTGDGAVAFQWTLALAVGEERTIDTSFGVNMPATAPVCQADFNGVGGVTVQDIFDFLIAYFGNSPSADINGVGGVTVQDIFDYLVLYFRGCP